MARVTYLVPPAAANVRDPDAARIGDAAARLCPLADDAAASDRGRCRRRRSQQWTRALLMLAVLAAMPAAAAGQDRAAEAAAGAADILALSPEMELFLADRIRPDQPRSTLVRALMDLCYDRP